MYVILKDLKIERIKMKKKLSLFLALIVSASVILTACGKDNGDNTNKGEDPSTSSVSDTVKDDFANVPSRYVYNQLNDEEKYLYKTIYNAISNFETEAVFDKEYDGMTVIKVYESVYFQEPELFWFRGESKSNDVPMKSVSLAYWCSKEELPNYQKEIDDATAEVMSKIPAGANDFDKLLSVHDSIAGFAQFEKNTDFSSTTIYGPLVTGPTQCEAYAKVMTYFMNKLDIQSVRMTGLNVRNGLTHAWNKVLLDGKWYNLDLTWDDPDGNPDPEYFTHNYFLIPDSEIDHISHIPVTSFEAPVADSLDMNYFIVKGLYAKSADEAEKMLEESMKTAAAVKAPAVQIKCETKEIYDQVINSLITNGKIMTIIDNINAESENKITSPSNASDEKLNIVNIKFKYQ